MNREHITKMMARRAATPGAANDLLKKVKILIAFAIANGWRKDDPTLKIKKFPSGAGHRSWSDAEINKYERRWPIGSKERLAFALFCSVDSGAQMSRA